MTGLLRFGLRLLLPALCVSWACAAAANAAPPPLLRCRVLPLHPVLGHAVQWVVDARNLPDIAPLPAARLGPQWRLQRQDAQRWSDGGQSRQTLRLRMYPMAASVLRLPGLRVGALACPARSVRVLEAAPGRRARYIAARIDTARPLPGQAVRVQLDAESAGALDWRPPQARSDSGILRPLSTLSTHVEVAGESIEVQRWSWSFTPLRAGDATIRFGVLRATHFGTQLLYPAPTLHVTVRPLPAYWADGAPVGTARLQALPAPAALSLGAGVVLRARLSGVQVGHGELLRLLAGEVAGPALRAYAPRVWRDPACAHQPTPCWNIAWPLRALRAGSVEYPRLRLAYYDPRRGAPELAQARWGRVRVHDPRPLRVALACGGVGALVALLALLRGGVLALRAAMCRARWARLARRGDADELLLRWRRARRRGEPGAGSLRAWVAGRRCGGRLVQDAALDALVAAAQRRRYGPGAPQ